MASEGYLPPPGVGGGYTIAALVDGHGTELPWRSSPVYPSIVLLSVLEKLFAGGSSQAAFTWSEPREEATVCSQS